MRTSGESKLDQMVALEYVELLLDKTIGRSCRSSWCSSARSAASASASTSALLYLLLDAPGERLRVAQAGAVIGAMTFNFALNNRFTYRDRS